MIAEAREEEKPQDNLSTVIKLWIELKGLSGIDLSSMPATAKGLQHVRENGSIDHAPNELLADMRSELERAVFHFHQREKWRRGEEIHIQRRAVLAGVFALLCGGALERAFHPLGALARHVSSLTPPSAFPETSQTPPPLPPALFPEPSQPRDIPIAKPLSAPMEQQTKVKPARLFSTFNEGNFERKIAQGSWMVFVCGRGADWSQKLYDVFREVDKIHYNSGSSVKFGIFKARASQKDPLPELLKNLGIEWIPCILLFRGGKLEAIFDGKEINVKDIIERLENNALDSQN